MRKKKHTYVDLFVVENYLKNMKIVGIMMAYFEIYNIDLFFPAK